MVAAQDAVKFQNMVSLIEEQSEGLKGYIGSLSPEALEPPSPCALWTVGDVVGHLVWWAEAYGGMLERGLRGDTSAPPGFPAVPGTLSGAAVDNFYGHAGIARRWSLGNDLLPTFNETYDHLNEMLQRIGPEDRDKLCYQTSSIRPVRWFLPVTISELAVHEWDIRSSLEHSPNLSAKSIPILMEYIPGRRWPWVRPFRSSSTRSAQIRYRFEFAGVAATRQDVVVEGHKPQLAPPGEGPVDLYLSGDPGTFVLLMYGRLTLGSAIAGGLFQAEGDLGLVPDFDRWLAGD